MIPRGLLLVGASLAWYGIMFGTVVNAQKYVWTALLVAIINPYFMFVAYSMYKHRDSLRFAYKASKARFRSMKDARAEKKQRRRAASDQLE